MKLKFLDLPKSALEGWIVQMKQEPALYWCLFHSALNVKLKVITSNWLNFKLVLQEPQKFQMRTGESSLLICSVSECTLTALIFQEKKWIGLMLNGWFYDILTPSGQNGSRNCWGEKGAVEWQQKGRDMVTLSQKLFKTMWSGYRVDCFLITPCASPLTNSGNLWILRKGMRQ